MHVMGGGDVGGAKTQIMNTVTGLSRNNEVMLISFRAGPFADEARERGIDVRVIERHNPFRAARTMRDLVDAFKPDIIHCHGGRANLMGAMVRRSRQVPIVTTVHSDYRLDYLGSPLKQTRSERRMPSRCAFSTSISRSQTVWRARSSSAALTRSAL